MPARGAVAMLPEDVREQLNRKLVSGSFSDYEGLEDWLKSQGFAIGKSSIQRYGKKFEERISALKRVSEQSRIIVEESPDDDNSVNEALIRLCQEKAHTLLVDMELDPESVDLPKLIRAIADIGRSSVQQKKWASEARKQALQEAADRVGDAARAKGFDEKEATFWRDKVLGVF